MSPTIEWMPGAREKVTSEIARLSARDLAATFPRARAVTVYDCFSGHTMAQRAKLVLGVAVRMRDSYGTHVVKLGTAETTGKDYQGWRTCVLSHNCSSRIMMPVRQQRLPACRVAAVYQDAMVLFGPDPGQQGPRNLETIVRWAVKDGSPDPISVERVICQIYADLAQWLYADSQPGEPGARAFYRRLLRRALPAWAADPARLELRRNVAWALADHDDPLCRNPIRYLDPYDFATWALQSGPLPETLVGRSHGDLHGRNVLVGVQRGEAEYPAVFDYGAMTDHNVIVWDFVKLETELKVRLIHALCEDEHVRNVLLAGYAKRRNQPPPSPTDGRPGAVAACSGHVERIACNFEFESLLGELTDEIGRSIDVESAGALRFRSIARERTGCPPLDRAIGILMRIRQEAAMWLGSRHQGARFGRRSSWKDEYYFALSCYGLCTAKYDYEQFETEHAVLSAGVAAARSSLATEAIGRMLAAKALAVPDRRRGAKRRPYPSYHVPLAHAHRLWQGTRTASQIGRARALLKDALLWHPCSVQLLQEYALVLAEDAEDEKALEMLTPLTDLCRVFCDAETLCRIGRLCKDMGDRALQRDCVPVTELSRHPAKQWYLTACERYKDAFAIHRGYYAGINAATLSLLLGCQNDVAALAGQVAAACDAIGLGMMTHEDRYWVLVTEGEANVLLRRSKLAAGFYRQALDSLHDDEAGMAQSSYDQLCRLYWAFSGFNALAVIEPVVALFRSSRFSLKPGPLGDCRRPMPARHAGARRASAAAKGSRRGRQP